jgi:hypothetical protein
MGVVVGLILIAVGAVLAFAVTKDPSGIDIDAVGWILLIVGFVSVLLDLLWWHSWTAGPWRRTTYVEGAPAPRTYAPWPRRRRIVEEDVPGPPDAPPPP